MCPFFEVVQAQDAGAQARLLERLAWSVPMLPTVKVAGKG
jgi:hypothetical protein